MNIVVQVIENALLLSKCLALSAFAWCLVYATKTLCRYVEEKRIQPGQGPVVSVSSTMSSAQMQVVSSPPAAMDVPPKKLRYMCKGKCRCRLPEDPIRAEAREAKSILIYRCGKCSKEQEIDPETDQPV